MLLDFAYCVIKELIRSQLVQTRNIVIFDLCVVLISQ